MGPNTNWARHNVTELIRQILRSVPPEPVYGTGRPFMTTYQIAIEFTRRFPTEAAALAPATGGAGQGPFALTVYLARWLPQEIGNGDAADLELRFLSPANMSRLEFDNNGTSLPATTHAAGFNGTMFRYLDLEAA